jgi:hypothetical protein
MASAQNREPHLCFVIYFFYEEAIITGGAGIWPEDFLMDSEEPLLRNEHDRAIHPIIHHASFVCKPLHAFLCLC